MESHTAHHPTGTGMSVGSGLLLRVPAADTAGALSVHEGTLEPGGEVPLHVHDEADQLLVVMAGEIEVTVGDSTFTAAQGDLIAKPHGVPHGFANRGDQTARVLEITGGDSFERMTLEGAASGADYATLQAKYGVHSVPT